MIKRGYSVRNVFDCFYFKSSETSVEEVKKIITDVAMDMYNNYQYHSVDLWSNTKKKRK